MLNHNHVHTQLRRSPRFSSSSSQANAPNACVAASPSAASSPSGLTKDQSLMLNCRAYGVEIFLNVEDMNSARSPVNATLKREFLRNVENKSLHENDNEELVPLKTYDTKFSGGKHLRRSPRFVSTPSPTGEGFRKRKVNSGEMKSADLSSSVIENSVSLRATDLSMWDAKRLRRLRLSSSNTMQHQERFRTSLAEMRSPEVENSVTFQVTDLKVWDSRCLRRSPRLSSYDSAQPQGQFPTSSAETKSPELEDSVSLRATDQKMWDDKRLRTSPRLSSANSTQPRGRFLTSSIEMKSPELENYVSLRVTDVKVLDGQCLRRSSPDSVQPQGRFPTISVETKSLELENFVTLQATDLKMLDGKCLRRSPRLLSSNSIQPQTRFPSSSAEMKSPEIENSVFLRAIDLKMWDDNFVQPQLRFLTSSVEMKPSGIENSLPLRASDMMGDDTCLRTSLRLSMLNSVQPHKIYLTSSQSSESVDDTNFVSFKTSDVTVTGEKCLRRSPSLAGAGSCNPTYACSKSSDSFEKQPWKKIMLPNSANKRKQYKRTSFFIGDPVPDREAQERWRWRYDLKNKRFKGQVSILNADDKEEIVTNVECHYAQATLDGTIFNLGDCAHIKKWALDFDKSACQSLKLNHPETQVRNETAEDFLDLLKEWEVLCEHYAVNRVERKSQTRSNVSRTSKSNEDFPHDIKVATDELEVLKLVDFCYGDPTETGKRGLRFKVRWKGYGPSEDTWESIEGLSNCQERIYDFVRNGLKYKILPRPGDVDVICGGPPCQGISGYNRFRNVDSPLSDERNHQIVIFMDIVKFLKPKYVLMENVVDLLKLDKASLGRYAISRLVHMKYQARLGIIAAGCYGLPQFRLRVFLWGAHPSESLPQFPLPTHDVIAKYWPPSEFECNTVAYDEGQPRELEKAVLLHDAISDLPAV